MDLVRKAVVVFIFIAVYKFNCTFCVEHQTEFYNLKVGQVLEHFNAEGEEKLSVYCFQGHQKRSPHKILASLTFRISSSTSDFELLSAPNASIIYDDYHTARSTWFKFTRAITPIRREMVHVPLFQQSCVGVVSKSNFKVILTEQWVDFWRLIFMVLSVICFWKAKELSSSTTFYYSFGTSVGVMSSVLLISFFLFNRIPRKNIAIGVILSGVSLTSYIISLLYNNFMEKLIKYRYYFIVYVVLSAAVSFGLIYRFQPGRHPRSMDLFRWTLQALSLLVLFYSSEMREFSVLVILGLLTIKAIPEGLKNALTRSINNLWFRRFPPKRRFLTEQEYIDQGFHETHAGLQHLRTFCSSPDANTWKLVRRLKDPQRFAEFMETGSHLTDEEILAYDSASIEETGDDSPSDRENLITEDLTAAVEPELSEDEEDINLAAVGTPIPVGSKTTVLPRPTTLPGPSSAFTPLSLVNPVPPPSPAANGTTAMLDPQDGSPLLTSDEEDEVTSSTNNTQPTMKRTFGSKHQ